MGRKGHFKLGGFSVHAIGPVLVKLMHDNITLMS